MRPRRLAAWLAAASLLAAGSGCINPFDPAADVEISIIESGSTGGEVIVRSSQLSGSTLPIGNWVVTVNFDLHNKVSVTFHSVEIVYTDSFGNQVTAYKSLGGRRYQEDYRMLAPTDNTGNFVQYGRVARRWQDAVYLVDRNVVSELQSASYPADHVMFATICYRGEDDNGHDVKVCGSIPIKYQ